MISVDDLSWYQPDNIQARKRARKGTLVFTRCKRKGKRNTQPKGKRIRPWMLEQPPNH
jgi:hypothetical protein